jgi:hypothetical protein
MGCLSGFMAENRAENQQFFALTGLQHLEIVSASKMGTYRSAKNALALH